MAAIQHSIEVNVPITRLYLQLTQFEDYPRFLENVETVEQVSKTHLHWKTKAADHPLEWDATLTEQEENRHIVWHNAHDGKDAGRIEMEELGPNRSKLSFILDVKPGRPSGVTGGITEDEIAQQLAHDLAALKEFLETSGGHPQAQARDTTGLDASAVDMQTQADIMNQARQSSMRRTAASMSGSPTEVLEDEPNESGPGIADKVEGMRDTRFSGQKP